MRVFILYWHPEPGSFNGAMFRTACETLVSSGHELKMSDLHAMRFDPVSGRHNFITVKDPATFRQQTEEKHATESGGFAADLESEMQKLEWCDLMIWQFPLWWFGLPATIKGWVDRVFAMGRIYGAGRSYRNGVFRGKRAMLSLTTGGPQETYRQGGGTGDIFAILRPVHRGMLQYVGFDVLAPQIVYGPLRMSQEERGQRLAAYSARLRAIFEEAPIEVGPYS